MADPNPTDIVPYVDPLDEDPNLILNFDENLNPMLLNSSNNHHVQNFPSNSSSAVPEMYDDAAVQALLADISPYLDPMIPSDNVSQTVPSHQFPQQNIQIVPQQINNQSSTTLWPNSPIPLSCTFCQVLREIVYTDGVLLVSRLQIHGKPGIISHALLYQKPDAGSSSAQQQQQQPPFQIIDFTNKNMYQIKAFVARHCLNQNSMGYFMLPDSLSLYYETLCCGLDWAEDFKYDPTDQNPDDDNSGEKTGMEQEVKAGDDMKAETSDTCLAEQRERVEKMKLSDMRDVFGLPIQKAAKRMKLCPTQMKKICRKQGLERWPRRKVKCIERQISILKRALESEQGAATRAQTEAEIEKLEKDLVRYCGGFPPTSLNIESN
ncbi:hypothetical protein K1719_010807 [Acacia pycnantha]|nr:hypothetical protein K1719_010807 [Acacia pycnantha]